MFAGIVYGVGFATFYRYTAFIDVYTVQIYNIVMWVKHGKTIIKHRPIIAIFLGGMNHFQSWVGLWHCVPHFITSPYITSPPIVDLSSPPGPALISFTGLHLAHHLPNLLEELLFLGLKKVVSWNRGTPSYHPSILYKPTILDTPHLWKPPYGFIISQNHPKTLNRSKKRVILRVYVSWVDGISRRTHWADPCWKRKKWHLDLKPWQNEQRADQL